MAMSAGVMYGMLAVLSYGLSDFLAKAAVDRYGQLVALVAALALGTSALWAYSLIFVKFPAVPSGGWALVIVSGLISAVGWLAFYRGLAVGKVSIVSPIASSWGIVPFAMAIVFLSERLTLPQALSSLSIFAGIFLVSVDLKELAALARKGLYAGAGLALLALLSFGIAGFAVKFTVDAFGAFYSAALVRTVALAGVFLYSARDMRRARFERGFFWLLLAVGVFDALGFLSFNFGLVSGAVSIVSAITSAIPFVVVLLAYVFLRERLALNQYLGILLTAAGFTGLALL